MAINVDGAEHVELKLVDKDKKAMTILPFNTSDDVMVDEDGNLLTDALPTIVDEDEKKVGFLSANDNEEETITNPGLIAALTGEEVEVPEEEPEEEPEP